MKWANVLVLLAALAAAGCGGKGDPAPGDKGDKGGGKKDVKKDDKKHEQHEPGPHGGVVFHLGQHHGELTFDPAKKECTLYILGEDEKTPQAVKAEDLIVTTKETKAKDGKAVPALTIKLTAKDLKDGKATTFVGTDPALGAAATFTGVVSGEVDGKPAEEAFP